MKTENSTTTVDFPDSDNIRNKIEELKLSLQQRLPNYESLLHYIHRALAIDQDVVQILTEEEIGVICAGLQKKTGIFIAEKEADKAARGAKAGGKKISLGDL